MANEITWRLEHEKIGRLLLHYAIPAVIGTMVNALYNIVDRIFIGQGVGRSECSSGRGLRHVSPSIWDEGRMRWRKRYWGMLSP